MAAASSMAWMSARWCRRLPQVAARSGGRGIKTASRRSQGAEQGPLAGKYREVERPLRLVYTQFFEPFPDSEVVITVTFESVAGATTVVSREVYPSKDVRDAALSSGMEDGMRESMDQLDQLVAQLAAAPAARRK